MRTFRRESRFPALRCRFGSGAFHLMKSSEGGSTPSGGAARRPVDEPTTSSTLRVFQRCARRGTVKHDDGLETVRSGGPSERPSIGRRARSRRSGTRGNESRSPTWILRCSSASVDGSCFTAAFDVMISRTTCTFTQLVISTKRSDSGQVLWKSPRTNSGCISSPTIPRRTAITRAQTTVVLSG